MCVRVGGEELESLSPAPHEANLLLNEGSINISLHVKLRGAGYITPALLGAAGSSLGCMSERSEYQIPCTVLPDISGQ